MKQKQTRVRMTLSVLPEVRQRIERLRKRTEAENMTEVIRAALVVYENWLDGREIGDRLVRFPSRQQ